MYHCNSLMWSDPQKKVSSLHFSDINTSITAKLHSTGNGSLISHSLISLLVALELPMSLFDLTDSLKTTMAMVDDLVWEICILMQRFLDNSFKVILKSWGS